MKMNKNQDLADKILKKFWMTMNEAKLRERKELWQNQ